ncbi:MAG: hypothetical protein QF689_02905 [Candidatus Latescibacteria bacterium]|nr:hypothetical protein [Candidatus Latescibacterota bacterium]
MGHSQQDRLLARREPIPDALEDERQCESGEHSRCAGHHLQRRVPFCRRVVQQMTPSVRAEHEEVGAGQQDQPEGHAPPGWRSSPARGRARTR